MGLYAIMLAVSLLLARARVRRTVRGIAEVCAPHGPHYDPALKMLSGYDSDHVQLIEDVIKGVRALRP